MTTQLFIAGGGKGVRLGELTKNTPKSMVVVYEKPLVGHIITTAQSAGIDQIVLGVDEGKEVLVDYALQYPVEIEPGCAEPLTGAFFHSAATRRPDVIIGVNGDTIYHPETVQRLLDALEAHPDASGAVLLSRVMRPFITSWWTYWRHRIEDGKLVAMDEVPGHEITTEYIMAAFRTSALERLSDGFREDFTSKQVPFVCHSYGWDYLTKLLLWKGHRLVGVVGDDLTLNINHPSDVHESPLFFEEPSLFRWNRMTPDGYPGPITIEQSLVLSSMKPDAFRAKAEWFGLEVVSCESRMLSNEQAFRLDERLLGGYVTVAVVQAAGAFHLAYRLVEEILKPDDEVEFASSTSSRSSFEQEFRRQVAVLDLRLK